MLAIIRIFKMKSSSAYLKSSQKDERGGWYFWLVPNLSFLSLIDYGAEEIPFLSLVLRAEQSQWISFPLKVRSSIYYAKVLVCALDTMLIKCSLSTSSSTIFYLIILLFLKVHPTAIYSKNHLRIRVRIMMTALQLDLKINVDKESTER